MSPRTEIGGGQCLSGRRSGVDGYCDAMTAPLAETEVGSRQAGSHLRPSALSFVALTASVSAMVLVEGLVAPLGGGSFRPDLIAAVWLAVAGTVVRGHRREVRVSALICAVAFPAFLMLTIVTVAVGPFDRFMVGPLDIDSHVAQSLIAFAMCAHALWGIAVLGRPGTSQRDTGADVAIGAGIGSRG